MNRRIMIVVLAIALLLMGACKQSPVAPRQTDQDLSGSGPVINEQVPEKDPDGQNDKVAAGDPGEGPKQKTTETKSNAAIEKDGNIPAEPKQPEKAGPEPEADEPGSAVEKQMRQAFDAGRGVWLLFTSHT